VSYDSAADGLRLQGNLSVTLLKGSPITLNASGSNYIEYDPVRGITIVGSITASKLAIVLIPKVVTLSGVSLGWDPTRKLLTAGTTLSFAGHGNLNFTAQLLNSHINQITVDARDLNAKLAGGFYLQRIIGSVDHLSPDDKAKVVISGEVEISEGPLISIALPKALGGPVEGFLWSVDGKGTLDLAGTFVEKGVISIIGDAASGTGLATGTASLSMDILAGTFSFTATESTLGGAFTVTGKVNLSTANGGTIDVQGTGSVAFPTVTLFGYAILKEELLGANIAFHITSTLATSYLEGWATVKVPYVSTPSLLGLKVSLDGTTSVLDYKNLPPGK
jgi:hypothetical protein